MGLIISGNINCAKNNHATNGPALTNSIIPTDGIENIGRGLRRPKARATPMPKPINKEPNANIKFKTKPPQAEGRTPVSPGGSKISKVPKNPANDK